MVSETGKGGADPSAGGRVILLLMMVVTAGLWLEHHLGLGIAKLGAVALVVGALGAVAKLVSWLGQKSTVGSFIDSKVKSPLRAILRGGSSPRPLRVIGAVLALLMATLSSVTVVSDTPEQAVTVSIAALDPPGRSRTESLIPGKPLVRFHPVVTSPFGRLFRVEATGYVTASLTVYPLVGRQVRLGRDLIPSPSVLFRPFVEGVSALKDGAVFRVSRVGANGLEPVATDSGTAASFLVGRPQPVTDAQMQFWSLELDAAGAPAGERARMLMLWKNPRQLTALRGLAPNDRLVAEITLRDRVCAHAEITLTGERLMDVLLMDVRC